MIKNELDKKRRSSKRVKRGLTELAKLAAMAGPSAVRRKSHFDTVNKEEFKIVVNIMVTFFWIFGQYFHF